VQGTATGEGAHIHFQPCALPVALRMIAAILAKPVKPDKRRRLPTRANPAPQPHGERRLEENQGESMAAAVLKTCRERLLL